MILLVHLLFGAALGHIIQNPILAVILTLFSHYLLDFFPHIEYPISNIKKRQWIKAIPEFLSIAFDFFAGIALIFFFSNNQPIIYICAFFSIVPDGLSILNVTIKSKVLEWHSNFHQKKIHFFRNKKISIFWRFSWQIIATLFFVLAFSL